MQEFALLSKKIVDSDDTIEFSSTKEIEGRESYSTIVSGRKKVAPTIVEATDRTRERQEVRIVEKFLMARR